MLTLSVELKHGTFVIDEKKYEFDNVLLFCKPVYEPKPFVTNDFITNFVTAVQKNLKNEKEGI